MERQHISHFQYDRHEIERALHFLSKALIKSGHNKKPVLLHSMQVAHMLWGRGYSQCVVVAAVLHDVVEDTDITNSQVAQEFGGEVALYVDAMTVTESRNFEQSSARCAEHGNGVLAIRAADLIENSYYYYSAAPDQQKYLKQKFTRFKNLYRGQLDKSLAIELDRANELSVKSLPDQV